MLIHRSWSTPSCNFLKEISASGMGGCTEEISDFPLGAIIGHRILPGSPISAPLDLPASPAIDMTVKVKTSGSEFSCDVVGHTSSPEGSRSANINIQPRQQPHPTSGDPASNGKSSQKTRGFQSNNGLSNFILIPLILKWEAGQPVSSYFWPYSVGRFCRRPRNMLTPSYASLCLHTGGSLAV